MAIDSESFRAKIQRQQSAQNYPLQESSESESAMRRGGEVKLLQFVGIAREVARVALEQSVATTHSLFEVVIDRPASAFKRQRSHLEAIVPAWNITSNTVFSEGTSRGDFGSESTTGTALGIDGKLYWYVNNGQVIQPPLDEEFIRIGGFDSMTPEHVALLPDRLETSLAKFVVDNQLVV